MTTTMMMITLHYIANKWHVLACEYLIFVLMRGAKDKTLNVCSKLADTPQLRRPGGPDEGRAAYQWKPRAARLD